jgi:acyl-[acyl-carrier-protein]-phospholipid O-acyltransferase/long-chain-fatty-acid--[acyl-carrier-protein] ligase
MTMATKLSDLLVKLAFRMVARPLFHTRIVGREYIPSHGPALLVSNHLTHLDSFLIGACCDPVVRFLVWKPYYDLKLLTWAFRLARAIPIWTDPLSAAQSIKRSRGELQEGQILCAFAEGSISRTGELLPFKRGLEGIVRGLEVPIVPVHLDGLWESVFSFEGGRFLWKRTRRLRHPVVVSFGAPLPASATADKVRLAVQELGARARGAQCPPVRIARTGAAIM